jgi:hypothetical protein
MCSLHDCLLLQQLGFHAKPVGLLNINGFYNSECPGTHLPAALGWHNLGQPTRHQHDDALQRLLTSSITV